eukprot:7355518-Prorocentrum_lima.AAC.1
MPYLDGAHLDSGDVAQDVPTAEGPDLLGADSSIPGLMACRSCQERSPETARRGKGCNPVSALLDRRCS